MAQISEWEASEKAMKQAQAERREKILVFDADTIFSLLVGLMNGATYLVRTPDGKQRTVSAIENVLPKDARLAGVEFGTHNTKYDFQRDCFLMRVVSKDFEPVDPSVARPELPPVVFHQSEKDIVDSSLENCGLLDTIITAPPQGLEIIVNKTQLEIVNPNDWRESESQVIIAIKPKA